MKRYWHWIILAILLALLCLSGGHSETSEDNDSVSESGEDRGEARASTVFLAILARNTAHTLPYFFSYIDRLDYPKDRMHIW